MGQRSQIYVAFNKNNGDRVLIARYYGWNYGSRMVSRARGLIEWIIENIDYLDYQIDKISRIADINFDFRDVVISSDIIAESKEFCHDNNEIREYIFNQDNNDGKLFISIEDNTIKYAFTSYDSNKPMTAEEYMSWGRYKTEEKDGSNYSENCKYLKEHSVLMTEEEIKHMMTINYSNI